MAQPTSFRVFLSAVSNELASYRIEVARVLRRKGLEVRDQEHFRQGGATLVETLRDYIRDCDAVIQLVGNQCGSLVEGEHAAALGEHDWLGRFREATGCEHASYTQWELLLAKQFAKPVFIFMTDGPFPPDNLSRDTPDQQRCQAEYRRWIERLGMHRGPLAAKERLVEDVLVLPFPDLGRPKPQNLRFASLGKLFKGREPFLQQLRASLSRGGGSGAAAIVGQAAVHGLGGIGKTRLAVEYAWRYKDDYTALLFITGDSPDTLRRNIAELCGPLVLDLPEQDRPEEEIRYAAALRWLRQHPGWFLILDNLDTPEAAATAEDLLSKLSGGHVVLTSRLSNWSGGVEPLELDVLTVDDAADFLLTRTQGRRRAAADDPQQARELAQELGQLALALEQAGAYISYRGNLTLAGYRQVWREQHDAAIEWFDERLMKYPRSVAVTWQTTMNQLSVPARDLLHRLAWLGPEPIPETLLDSYSTGESEADPHEALAELKAWSLVTREPDGQTFTVHRLVQDVTRRSLRDEPQHASLNHALQWINAAFDFNEDDVLDVLRLDPLVGHGAALAEHADTVGIAEPTARLMSCVARVHQVKASYRQAEPLYRRALAIDEQSYGPEHPTVATRLNYLAWLLKETNHLFEAEPLMRRALAIDEQSYGAEHTRVAIDLNDLAQLLKATNRLSEAEPMMRCALAIDEQSYGAEHPIVAIRLNNLAMLLKATNRLSEAEPLIRRALAIDEQSYGAEHPNVAIRLNNLAQLLQEMWRKLPACEEQGGGGRKQDAYATLLAEAEPMMRRTLAIDEQSYGPEHPEVALDLWSLAVLLRDTDRLAEALPLMERARVIYRQFEQSTGFQHPAWDRFEGHYRGMRPLAGEE